MKRLFWKPPSNELSVCTLMLLAMRKISSQQLNSLSLGQAEWASGQNCWWSFSPCGNSIDVFVSSGSAVAKKRSGGLCLNVHFCREGSHSTHIPTWELLLLIGKPPLRSNVLIFYQASLGKLSVRLSERSEVRLGFKTETPKLVWIICLAQGHHSWYGHSGPGSLLYFALFQL